MADIDYSKYGAVSVQPPPQNGGGGDIDYSKYGAVSVEPPRKYDPIQDYIRNAATGINPISNAMWGAGHALGQIPAHAAQLMGFPNAAQAISNTFTAPPLLA